MRYVWIDSSQVVVVQLGAFDHTHTTTTSHSSTNAVSFVVSRIKHRLLRIESSGFSAHGLFDPCFLYCLSGWLRTPLTDHTGASPCLYTPGLFPCNMRYQCVLCRYTCVLCRLGRFEER